MSEYQDTPLEIVGNDALASIERAQIDTQIATAKKYPRNIGQVKQAMMSIATLDEETAASCFYVVPRGGKSIQGPSVRMAEIALSSYGNVKAGTRILSVHTGENPHAVVQAVVHDLEKNVAYSVEKRRRIVGKRAKGGKPDEDDINLAVNAGSAIAFRDAVFKVVPGALVKSVFEAAKRVAVGDARSLAASREKVVGRLKQMGIPEARIFAAVGVAKLEEVTTEHLETLIGLGTSIRDGQTSIEEAFPEPVKVDEATPRPAFRRATANPPESPEGPAARVETVKAAGSQPAAESTPQDALASLVTGWGYTFDEFSAWARAQDHFGDAVTAFDEVPGKLAEQLTKASRPMRAALAAAKEGGLL